MTGAAQQKKQAKPALPPERLNPGEFINYPAVRNELGINDQQRQKLDSLRREAQEDSRKLFAAFQKTPPAQRRAKLAELSAKRAGLRASREKRVQAILTQPQRERLRGIAIQLRGCRAFQTQELIKALKLDQKQLARFQQLRVERSAEIRKLVLGRADGAAGVRDMLSRLNEMETRLTKRAVGLLNEHQKLQYRALTGQEFDRSKIARRP